MPLNQFPRRSFVGSSTLQTFTGTGSQTAFTLSSAQTQNECFVFVEDVAQVPGVDFTVNGTTLTFTIAPANNAEIVVRGFGVPAPVTTVSDGAVTAAKLATGAIEAKLGYTPVSPTQLSTEVNNLIAGAPGALNTLDELAAALGDDANYAATITNALSAKANQSTTYTKTEVDNLITPGNVSDKLNPSTGYFDLPAGTTAQRPISPVAGMIRYNTTTSRLEAYQNGEWVNYSQSYTVEYLVIAGGAGGGFSNVNTSCGGGGAGGYRSSVSGESSGGGSSAESPITVTSNTQFTVIIGAGGASPNVNSRGDSGSNSSFGPIVSVGGGGGGGGAVGTSSQSDGGSGGSGGGGLHSRPGGSGTSGQGFAGGSTTTNGGPNWGGGGGGGAGAVGGNGNPTTGGNGGNGVTSSITGTAVTRAGGGGGSVEGGGTIGSGGLGGGGAGGMNSSIRGVSGTANTGSGGGGGTFVGGSLPGGNGGSGIVIVRYLGPQKATGGTVTSSGGYTIHTFTSSGTFTA